MLYFLDFSNSFNLHTRKYNLFTSYIRDSINTRQTMELNIQGRISLDILRNKITANNNKWDFDEKIHIQTIYQAITKKTLSLNCSGCWINAVNIINNFIRFHETAPLTIVLDTEVISGKFEIMSFKEMKSLLKKRGIKIPRNATREILNELLK